MSDPLPQRNNHTADVINEYFRGYLMDVWVQIGLRLLGDQQLSVGTMFGLMRRMS